MKTINTMNYETSNSPEVTKEIKEMTSKLAGNNKLSVENLLDMPESEKNAINNTTALWKIFWKNMQAVNNKDYQNNSPTKQLMNMFWIPEKSMNNFTIENVLNIGINENIKSYSNLHKEEILDLVA